MKVSNKAWLVIVLGGLGITSAGACDSTPGAAASVDAAVDMAAEVMAVNLPDAMDSAVDLPEVTLFGTTCQMPNPASSGLPNPAMYDTGIPGTVFDRMTGLMWQRSAGGSTYSQAGAAAYCKNNKLGGYADWRLPTLIELVSIVDFTASSPSIDALTFQGTSSNLYWTGTPLVGHPNNAWYVGFGPGNSNFLDITASSLARCVRTSMNMAAACFAPGARFKLDAGLVTDASTGLVWQQAVPVDQVTWPAAKAACAAAGEGFRLPSLKELQTLVDYGMAYPGPGAAPGAAIDPTAFPATPPAAFWTSSSVSGSSAVMWIVRFDNGDSGSSNIAAATDIRYVRCVH